MKKYSILLWLAFGFTALQAQVVFENAFPQAGQSVPFTYTPQNHLKNVENIEAYVYLSDGKLTEPSMQKVDLQKAGSIWKGQINPKNDTKGLMLAFFETGKTEAENNKGKGYTQIFYDEKKKPLSGAFMSLLIISDFVRYFEIEKEQKKEWAKQEFKNHPDNKLRYFNAYATLVLNKDDKKAFSELKSLEKKKNLEEDEMNVLYYAYRGRKDQAKMQEWEQKILAQYPKGSMVENQKVTAIFREQNAEKRNDLINNFLQEYPNSARKNDFEAMRYWSGIRKASESKDLQE
ncbi:MAG: hypothetical protein ACK40K_03405, partial [Raineya sp.]